jgi:hypothetical protein
MSRIKNNQTLQREMCARLVELLDDYLQLSDVEAAKALGYSGAATLWKIRRGSAFVGAEKLAVLATLGDRNARPNIHWLISGEGLPLLTATQQTSASTQFVAFVSRLSAQQQRAIRTLVGANARRARGAGPMHRQGRKS